MSKVVLVTGATGYVATRLIPALLQKGYRVRCLVRSPRKLKHRSWLNQVELIYGDVLDEESLVHALKDVQVAFYLIHNMSSGKSYRENERKGASNFGRIARASCVEQIVFLGGLGGSDNDRHMKSRKMTGEKLRESGVPVTEFRSSVIIGSGSISFELIRFLTLWLPFIPAPKQTNNLGQPIGIRDLLLLLLAAIETPECKGKIIEVGGADQVSYPEMMVKFAESKKLDRPVLKLPFYFVPLSARLADLMTPVPYSIAYPLMEELTSPSVVGDPSAQNEFPNLHPSGLSESIDYASARREYENDEGWLSALVSRHPLDGRRVRTSGEGLLIEYQELDAFTNAELLKTKLTSITIDKWSVEKCKEMEYLCFQRTHESLGILRVEFRVENEKLIQLIMFEPNGIPGLLWWKFFYPINGKRMAESLRKSVFDL